MPMTVARKTAAHPRHLLDVALSQGPAGETRGTAAETESSSWSAGALRCAPRASAVAVAG